MTKTFDGVCCSFCGLLCDDLSMEARDDGTLAVTAAGCGKAATSYARITQATPEQRQPHLHGKPATLAQALDAAASLLWQSRLPLFAGLATDVHGMRGLMRLADRCGAVLDHMNATAKFRNILTVQDNGWITTTFAELRNRADLVVLIGSRVEDRYPRFFERLVWPKETLFLDDLAQRRVVHLGPATDLTPATSPTGVKADSLDCERAALPEVLAALRAIYNGRPLDAATVGGVPVTALQALAESLRKARYAVLVWAAPDLDFPHAELTVQTIAGLLDDLNVTTRAAGLPLGGNDGDFSADAVMLWQSGFPFRMSFAPGYPDYDPRLYDTAGLLERGEADLMLWVSSLDSLRPRPATTAPTIVLASAGTPVDPAVPVWIPVATPGVDTVGHMLRGDKIIALPLPKLIETGLPTVAAVADALLQRTEPASC